MIGKGKSLKDLYEDIIEATACEKCHKWLNSHDWQIIKKILRKEAKKHIKDWREEQPNSPNSQGPSWFKWFFNIKEEEI